MKECSEKKILNPITNRCVNINGKIGKRVLKNNYIINISNENNSCYIDSLFVALFHFKNRVLYNSFFRNKLLERYPKKIQDEIYKIYKYINKYEDIPHKQCYFIRKYLDKYYNFLINKNSNNKIFFNNSDNWLTQQIDIFELLTFLDKIFNFEQNIKIKDGNNKYIKNMIVEISSYNLININVLDISTLIPIKIERYNLDRNNYYNNSNGELIKYYEKKYEIIKTKGILFIQLYRNSGREKLTTKIIYPNKINIKSDKKALLLRSIILHKGSTINSGHYTTIIKRAGKTYEYDDMFPGDNKLVEIDDEYERKQSKNVVGLIYSKMST